MARPGRESDNRREEFGCRPEDSRRMERLEGSVVLRLALERADWLQRMVGQRREQPGGGDQSGEGLRERGHRSQEKRVFQRKERAAGLTMAKRKSVRCA